ncbi:MAG: hypothetical protein ABFC54_02580 [Thermoguttaceae bacterium]
MLLTGALLLVFLTVIAVDRVDYCGRPSKPPISKTVNSSQTPTLAPTQEVVFLHVESDSAELEISLVGN